MREDKARILVTIFAILCIVFLEVLALIRGIDGVVLALSIAVIALLAPSPTFQIHWGRVLKVIKDEKPKESEEG